MRPRFWLCLSLLIGCGDKVGDDTAQREPGTESDVDTDTDTDTDTDADADADADLDALIAGLPQGFCEEVAGYEDIPGAVSYFVGEYIEDGEGAWSGEERWLLYANQAWKDTGGTDCQVVWSVSGTETDRGSCGTCDFGMSVQAVVDAGSTTCPNDLWAGQESWSAEYAVDTDAGAVRMHFYSSGKEFAAGEGGKSHLVYASEGACVWF